MYINFYFSPYKPSECPCGPVTQNRAECRCSIYIVNTECGEHNSDNCHDLRVFPSHTNTRTNELHKRGSGEHHPDICHVLGSFPGHTNIRTNELHRRGRCGEHNSDNCHDLRVFPSHTNIRTAALHRRDIDRDKCGEHNSDICHVLGSFPGHTNIRTSGLHRNLWRENRINCGNVTSVAIAYKTNNTTN